MPSRSYDNHHRNPNHSRGGFSGGGNYQRHQPFDSPPPNYPAGGGDVPGFRPMGSGPGFRPMGGGRGGGFRPMGGGEGGGFSGIAAFSGGGSGFPMPHAGQKRGHSSGRGSSPPDGADGGSFAKLFIGSVPRTATEEDIRPLFEEHGDVIEVALLKDKRTGLQQGPLRG